MILIDSVMAANGQRVVRKRRACRKCHRVKVGADATLEQLALEWQIQRITPRIGKVLRRIERAA